MRLDDKLTLKKLREAIDRALLIGNVAEDFGLTSIKAGRISYDINGLSAKITLEAETTENGKTKEEANFEQYAVLFGLKPEWLHKSFDRGRGATVEIIGLQPSRSKFPVMVLDANKGRFLITAEEVQRKLNGKGGVA
jgi:hypothetical protein